ncbi:hypothetical protein Patl1_29574 [Pistacia atlantica]|uniref:Uncharacterized protein n=1 Tax=Pistacia atlantica TaxID=434234 RepID=A0ACC1A8G9_9ROSI|nr:hypothetical protein Patl1_29574 [Pistacia atlantica]
MVKEIKLSLVTFEIRLEIRLLAHRKAILQWILSTKFLGYWCDVEYIVAKDMADVRLRACMKGEMLA